jgi:hypothetical protein
VRDLFDIFVDLPRIPRPAQDQRVEELRQRVRVVRQRGYASVLKQRTAAVKAVSRRGRRT